MPVDTRGFQEQHIGKRLRIELSEGQTEEIDLLELTICEEPEPCCGITYRLVRTDQSDNIKKQGAVYWAGFSSIAKFEVVGDTFT